jgi:hypothetical protein
VESGDRVWCCAGIAASIGEQGSEERTGMQGLAGGGIARWSSGEVGIEGGSEFGGRMMCKT